MSKEIETKEIVKIKSEQLNGKEVKIIKRELTSATPNQMDFTVTYLDGDTIKETKDIKSVKEIYELVNPEDSLENSNPDSEVLLIATLVKIQYPNLKVYLNELFKDNVSDKWTVTLELPKENR